MFDQITILGPGLLGASIGIAASERGLTNRIVSWSRRAETRGNCQAQSWCDEVFDTPEAACRGSQLVIICTPVQTIVPLLSKIAEDLAPEALVTDVGSTKSRICRDAMGVDLNGATFIGSHPMAGSEQTGLAHARGNLFDAAACIVTPLEDAPSGKVRQISTFWESLGMQVTHASPEHHDEIVAHISHLPHLLSSALCSFLASKDPTWKALAGGGLRDTTRIASGDPGLWRQILESNREEVIRAISGMEEELHQVKSALTNEDAATLNQRLERGKHYRDSLSS
ncbi:prephenate dehydrogenase/arogenate dehydrogenase family protein [Coraliomargarita sinensis]|uniref:Prephenate dehydrogenase/arogenate dehydrogenase family protein n=1 Tax=Coraliomargarita sinensis TaxID=2174842 RepID=A0A317ZNT7_9BACT|nr:prephenate dehydrogenase/arogenate dehydrogenase family protein [Coraliomargarita sinensis]PXA05548.1 prephenate dehydrogenase/arogenate dehydrogenase family protein [Coraliomargarita sinensis]